MIGAAHTWALPGAKWFMHRSVKQDLLGIETSGGGPVWSPGQGQNNPDTLLGYPVVLPEVLPMSPGTASSPAFAFGNLRKTFVLGDRRAPEMETSEHYAFNTDQLTLRFSARIAFLATQANSMVVYETNAA